MRVALIGSTGLVGRLLLDRLLAAGHGVHALQRSPALERPGLTIHVAPAEQWPAIVARLTPEAAISALGTTSRKAGSEAAFRRIDHDHVLAFARAAREAGAARMVSISSVGADAGSANFYLRIKGEVEEALADLGFDRLDLLSPGLLRGPRGADRRLKERLGIALSPLINPLLRGRLARYAAIDADVVATAAAALLDEAASGTHIHHNDVLNRIASGLR